MLRPARTAGAAVSGALRTDARGALRIITLNRPESLNAINGELRGLLIDVMRSLNADEGVRAVVVTGAGERAFCSGQDLKERLEPDAAPLDVELRERYNPIIRAMRALDRPIVGAINGIAAGAGASLAFACDLRIAAEGASFLLAFGRVGLIPDSGATWLLPRLVGPAKAAEMALLTEPLSGDDAERLGLVLRVVPPAVDPTTAGTRPVTTARIETRPLAPAASASGSAPTPPAAAPAPAPAPAHTTAAPRDGDDEIHWIWPANGPVVTAFDDARSKGVAITGKVGDPVVAAADGRVVYAGSGLRGYGNLVILKHNNTYLTAYAHNQTLLVKEDQAVRRGQKIAEMGSTDAERVQLHFEIRKLGKPVDPAKLLPPR